MNLRQIASAAIALLKPGALSHTPIGTDGLPQPGTVVPLALQPKWLRDLAGSSGDYRINLVIPIMKYVVTGTASGRGIYRPFDSPLAAAQELSKLERLHGLCAVKILPRQVGVEFRKVDEFSGTFEDAVSKVEARKLALRETGMTQALYVEFAVEDKRTTKILYTTETDQEVVEKLAA